MRVITVIFMIWVATLCSGQQSNGAETAVSPVLARMNSQKWSDRSRAFDEAVRLLTSGKSSPADADRLRFGVIQLLAIENSDKEPTANEEEGDENSEYYSGLIDFVAHSGDERSIPALLGAALTGGIATRGVARFGKKALDPTLEQAQSGDPKLASGAVYVLQKMLKIHTVDDSDSHRRIKNALQSSIASSSAEVRLSAIYAIEYLDDREDFLPLLKGLAQNDPNKISGQAQPNGSIEDIYPVRELARKLLGKIETHERLSVDQGMND